MRRLAPVVLIAIIGLTAVVWFAQRETTASNAAAAASPRVKAPQPDEARGQIEVPPPAARDERAPAAATEPEEKVVSDGDAPDAIKPPESEQQTWERLTEGKSAADLDGAINELFLELTEAAMPEFDALEKAGDFEVVDDEVPFNYASRPEDNDLMMQTRCDGTRMIRLVLPAQQHPELYAQLRYLHWVQRESVTRRPKLTKND